MAAIYWFDPDCDEQAIPRRPGSTPGRPARRLAADLELLPLFLADAADVVLVRAAPRPGFLASWRAAGWSLPRTVVVPHGAIDTGVLAAVASALDAGAARTGAADAAGAPGRPVRLCPWGWSPDTAAFLAPLAALGPLEPAPEWHPARAAIYSKALGAGLLARFLRRHPSPHLCPATAVGAVCADRAEVGAALARAVAASATGQAVVKALYGQAGRRQLIVSSPNLEDQQAAWVDRALKDQGAVVVEAWLERVMDLSVHLELAAGGSCVVVGQAAFLADSRGHFRGAIVRPAPAALAPARLPPPRVLDSLAAGLAETVGDALRELGHVGPAGVDMLVYRAGSRFLLKPIVEINPRFTMGRLALCLARRVAREAAALWLLISARQAAAAGWASLGRLGACLAERRRPVLAADGIRSGVLCTSDPARATGFLSLLVVDRDLATCQRVVDEVLPGWRAGVVWP